jgi:hypothetical protein
VHNYIPAYGRLRQKDCELEDTLSLYNETLSLREHINTFICIKDVINILCVSPSLLLLVLHRSKKGSCKTTGRRICFSWESRGSFEESPSDR